MQTLDLDSLLTELVQAPGHASENVHGYLHPVDKDKLSLIVGAIDTLRQEVAPEEFTTAEKRSWRSNQNRNIGLKYEELIQVLFENSQVFNATTSQRTIIGEIDIVLTFTALAPKVPLLVGHTTGIGEAKCHQTNLKSDWVTEMSGNLRHNSIRFGFIFTFCNPRTLGADSIQAIKEAHLLNTVIIPFGRKQFDRLISGESFLKLISEQNSLSKIGSRKLEV